MNWRRFAIGVSPFVVLALLAGNVAGGIDPTLTTAVSRRNHAGTMFDIPLPLTGGSGIESRRTGGTMQLVLFFDQPITAATTAVTQGTSAIAGTPAVLDNTLTINLTGVGNITENAVTVSNVQSAAGGLLASLVVPFRTLEGDVNGNGSVSGSDVNIARFQVGAQVTGFNYRSDINQNLSISGSDVNLITAKVNSALPGGPIGQQNTPPTIDTISDQTTDTGSETIQFVVGDAESQAASLAVSASSDNPTLLPPDTAYAFSVNGNTRTMTVTAATGQTGVAHVTVKVGDGIATNSTVFTQTVTATPSLFLAAARPGAGDDVPGNGNRVAEDGWR
jgi:hypothetical protein